MEVCRSTFVDVFNVGKKGFILDQVAHRDRSKPIVLDSKNKTGSKSRWDQEILDHLKTFKRVTSHYSATAAQGKASGVKPVSK